MSSGSDTTHGPGVRGFSHLVIDVADTDRAARFYGDVLGLGKVTGDWPEADETALQLPSGQFLVLKAGRRNQPPAESGVHQAYRCSRAARSSIAAQLENAGIAIHRYHEDRPAEIEDPFYFFDPDGNRIQLVTVSGEAPGIWGIDHVAVQASDMEWEEDFFIGRLGFAVDHRVGWNTKDYVSARAWGEGRDDMAPGTRRMDHRYRDNPGAEPGSSREVPRPNIQIFLDVGGAALGIFLATRHHQEPAPDLARGAPRAALATDRPGLEKLAQAVSGVGVALEGPVDHDRDGPLARSLYFRDPCGNFFEVCVPKVSS